ncbi:BglG family transcription antiterminator [Sporolactobacillus laevolacticus]|uniref:Ascorbate-specific PTS system EIIA component n=1 Tax=Sporolactobacillus laevolacticus DSM 442 TaxID=1395513 RepID=V6IVN3_9BACL|nr:BglG family transcription antiterminator [Sporolactobacillus laevolacticus]EST11298.1 hypothetical protein P343_13285 [Sporolactobacillus laevolacticus DSM 442]
MLDQRAAQLFQTILKYKFITMKQLESITGMSRRMIQYDLQKINDWLDDHQLAPIRNRRGYGLVVDGKINTIKIDGMKTVLNQGYDLSEEERLCVIYLLIFIQNDYLPLQQFISTLRLSRNTMIELIKRAGSHSMYREVSINYDRRRGYFLSGSEWEIRNLARECVSKIYHLASGMELLAQLYNSNQHGKKFFEVFIDIHQKLTQIEDTHQIKYVEDNAKELAAYLVFLLFRINACTKSDFPRHIIHYYVQHLCIEKTQASEISKMFIRLLGVASDQDEHVYFTTLFLGLQLKEDHLMRQSLPEEREKLDEIANQMIRRFEQLSSIPLKNRDFFKKNLMMHLEPCYYRLIFDTPVYNPYLKSIKKEYLDLFFIVRYCLKNMEKLIHKTISDDEIGFLTLHFASILKDEGVSVGKKSALIVCPKGIGISNMLKQQLMDLFPDMDWAPVVSVKEFSQIDEAAIDLIFSTVPLKTSKSLFVVKPILSDMNKVKLLERVNAETKGLPIHFQIEKIIQVVKNFAEIRDEVGLYEAIGNVLISTVTGIYQGVSPMLNDLLFKDEIQFKDHVNDWKEAIQVAAQPLLDRDFIQPSYVNAMIETVENVGPYIVITPHVAIPHARPERGVNQLGMSLLHLAHPVEFVEGNLETSASIIIVLAAVDNKTHLKALRQLTELLGDDENIDEMIRASSVEEISQIIEKYSH